MTHALTRRALLALSAAAAMGGCTSTGPTADENRPPILFVHGSGDSAALWTATLWRFESNGWPRGRLKAVDLPDPTARDDDGVPQPGRSSTAEQAQALSAAVDALLARTGARQLVLVGNS